LYLFRPFLGSKITYYGMPSGVQAPNRYREALLRTWLPNLGVRVVFSYSDGKLDLCQHIHRTSRQDNVCRMPCGAGSRPVSSFLRQVLARRPCMYHDFRSSDLKELIVAMDHADAGWCISGLASPSYITRGFTCGLVHGFIELDLQSTDR
jgi:hypothetical protein